MRILVPEHRNWNLLMTTNDLKEPLFNRLRHQYINAESQFCSQMVRCFLVGAILLTLCNRALSQASSISWAYSMKNPTNTSAFCEATEVVVDLLGNIYITGSYERTVDMDPGPGVTAITAHCGSVCGLSSVYIAKYSGTGALKWVRTFGNTNGNTECLDMFLDANSNLWIGGYTTGTLDIDPGPAVYSITSGGAEHGFVARYDTAGNFISGFNLPTNSKSMVRGLAVDVSGNLFVTGGFAGTTDFDPTAGTSTFTTPCSVGCQMNGFYVKYSSAGALVWKNKFGGGSTSTSSNYGACIAVDNISGNIAVGGRLLTTGYMVVANSGGSVLKSMTFNGDATVAGAAFDSSGDLYYSGSFWVIEDFNWDAGTNNLNPCCTGYARGFVAKYSGAAYTYNWAVTVPAADQYNRNLEIAFDNLDNVLFGGSEASTFSSSHFYFGKLDKTNGSVIWKNNFTGSCSGGNNQNYCNGISYSPTDGKVIVAGCLGINFNTPCSFDVDATAGTYTLSTNGGFEIFLGKYGNCALAPVMPLTISGGTVACQNVPKTYSIAALIEANTYSWSLPGGWTGTSATNTVVVNPLSSGEITLSANNTCGTSSVTMNVSVIPSPTIVISGESTVCAGSTLSLSASGASTISWSNGSVSPVISVTPSLNTIYTATGSSGGCDGITSITITVLGSPTVTVNSGSICAGNSFSISPVGGSNYTISGGSGLVSPISNTVYTVIGTNSLGCTSSAISTVMVEQLPVVTVNSGSICSGQNFTVSPSGALTYSVSGGNFIVGPVTNTIYSIAGTGSNGCISAPAISSVAVFSSPVINSAASTSILCNGGATGGLTVNVGSGSAPFTYSWTPSAASASNLAGLAAGNYTVIAYDQNQCAASASFSVLEPPALTLTTTASNLTVCAGVASTLIASGGGGVPPLTYSWIAGVSTGTSIVNPLVNSTYTAVVSDFNNCSHSQTISIFVKPTPTVSVNSGSVCIGQSFTIIPAGAANYNISGGTFTVSPGTNTNYIVTGTGTNGCVSASVTSTVLVFAPPTLLSASTTSVACSGAATGGATVNIGSGTPPYTYSWSPAAGNNSNVAGMAAGIYTVTAFDQNLCSVSATFSITQPQVISLSASASNLTVCAGAPSTLIASGSGGTPPLTYSWVAGALSATNVVNPPSSLLYTAVVRDINNCVQTQTIAITANPLPTVSVNSGSICQGQNFILFPAGANSYVVTGGTTVVSPAQTSTYGVTGTSALGCVSSNAAIATVTVHQLPVIAVNSGSICTGQSYTINPSGAATYSIAGGNTIVSPLTNTSYAVSGTSSAGCVSSNTAVATVSVYLTPTVAVNSGSICGGDIFTIVPTGADSYVISGGSFTVSPINNSSYFVTGMSSMGCVSANTVVSSVTVFAVPSVSILGVPAICTGGQATLTATGANTYLWDNNANSATISVLPVFSSTYSVTGTDANGCQGVAVKSVVVNPLPNVTASASSTVICLGNTSILNGGGAVTYQWSGGVTNNTPFSPAVTANYTVTGTDLNNCENTATIQIVVNDLPIVTASASSTQICTGNTVSLQGGGANTYQWSGGVTNNTPFSPNSTAAYTVTGTDANGCQKTADITVTVLALPNVSVSSTSSLLCTGESATLTVGGANLFNWSTGDQAASIVVSPGATTNYTVTGTDANGCSKTVVVEQKVDECTGIKMENEKGYLEIFPNPNAGSFTIRATSTVSVTIYNDLGQLVYKTPSGINATQVEIEDFSKGIYFVITQGDTCRQVLKMVVAD